MLIVFVFFRFFTAQFQTEKTEIQKVVCFCPEKHETCKGAEMMDKPFQIIRAKVQPDGQGTATIKCFKEATLLSSNRDLGFQKTYKKHLDFEPRQEVIRLGNIEEYQMVILPLHFYALLKKNGGAYSCRFVLTSVSLSICVQLLPWLFFCDLCLEVDETSWEASLPRRNTNIIIGFLVDEVSEFSQRYGLLKFSLIVDIVHFLCRASAVGCLIDQLNLFKKWQIEMSLAKEQRSWM
ncbi:hypothetical protein DPMN_039355 [Dreissena polymorpha]|uniref:Uncharacterized protein n=1 Tax=Dreissena polymorpha TaxID=45954 RepID=A0A9D4RRJ6_DREPO|nr:hypothetical protein DPMN_039355 [Dreissena polymorpha]